jgi:hypothetical protein
LPNLARTAACFACCYCADTDQKSALAKSHFALLWRRAVQHNPFIQAFMLNFGAIGEARLASTAYVLLPAAAAAAAVKALKI